MKKIIVLFIYLSCFYISVLSQEKKWEHSLGASFGAGNPLFALKFEYGLSYRITPKWSVKTGVGVLSTAIGCGEDIYQDDTDIGYVGIPFLAQYHIKIKNTNQQLIFGLGPSIDIYTNRGIYYGEWISDAPLNSRDFYRKVNVSLQPNVTYRFNKIGLGFEGNIGLLKMKEPYVKTDDHAYLHSFLTKFSFNF